MGILVWPPTNRTSLISEALTPASFRQSLHGCLVRFNKSATRLSNLQWEGVGVSELFDRIEGKRGMTVGLGFRNCVSKETVEEGFALLKKGPKEMSRGGGDEGGLGGWGYSVGYLNTPKSFRGGGLRCPIYSDTAGKNKWRKDGAGEGGGGWRSALGPGNRHAEMLGTRGVCGDERKVDVGVPGCRQLALGLLGSFPQPLYCQPVLGEVNALHGVGSRA